MSAYPTVIESVNIGIIAGNVAHAWVERTGGDLRYFKDVLSTVFSPALGRDICLTNPVEITANEYGVLFSVFAAA